MSFSTRLIGLKRLYATATGARVTVPLVLHGLEGRYASALFTAASKKAALAGVEKDLGQLQQTLKKEQELGLFFSNPTLTRGVKQQTINKLCQLKQFNALTVNLLALLVENGRLGQISRVIENFQSLMRASRGEVTITVTSAQRLEDKTLADLKQMISQRPELLGVGKAGVKPQNIFVENKVKPAILGGLVIEMGDKTIDTSVSRRIARYTKVLNDTLYYSPKR